ncbi:MAG: signal peptidase II [Clostridia bacterium]|nr:signal peptidase II [Clostridia bacterium]
MSVVISLISVAILVCADQLIKLAVETYLAPVTEIGFIDGFVGWHYVRNTGAAFGMMSGKTEILSVVTGIVLAVGIVLIAAGKIKPKFYLVCAVMIVSGGIGNLIDHIFKGYVVDYIEFQFIDFAVFNFADILITCGAAMVIIKLIAEIIQDIRKKSVGDANE